MNIVTASFNTAMRQMTEMSHDQNVSEKKTEHLSSRLLRGLNKGAKKRVLSRLLRGLNQGAKLVKMLKHDHILNFTGYGRVF